MEEISIISKDICEKDSQTLIMELNKILTEITGDDGTVKIIDSLEREAKALGYSKLVLETRVQNTHAIAFYGSLGYQHCEAYGKYVGKQNAYCCEKILVD